MTAINTDERFCCGPTHFGPPPLCARTRIDYICAPQAVQLQVRDVRVFRSWGSRLQLMAAPSHRDHLPVGMELTGHCACLSSNSGYNCASLGQRKTGRSRSRGRLKRAGGSCVLGSNLSQPHLTAEEYWNQLAGTVRRARQSFLQVTRKHLERPEDTAAALLSVLHARKAVVGSFSSGSCGSHGLLPCGFVLTVLTSMVCPWARSFCILDCTRKVGYTSRSTKIPGGNHHLFSDSLCQ